MPTLNPHPQLADLQEYVVELENERGFAEQGLIEKCLLLGEEVGELFKSVRTSEGLSVDVPGGDASSELADILIYVCAIANRLDVDLETAFRAKEAENHGRTWQ